MLEEGIYTVVHENGQYQTYRIQIPKSGGLIGKRILKIKDGPRYRGIAFLSDQDHPHFWKRFREDYLPEELAGITEDFRFVTENPQEAQRAFAMREGRCARCYARLTVPASIHNGLGPDCAAKVRWLKKDQIEAYQATKQENEPSF